MRLTKGGRTAVGANAGRCWAWRLVGPAIAAALIVAAYWAVRLAYADLLFRRNTLPAIRGALRLAPGNAEYHVRLGELAEQSGADPGARIRALREACRLSPRDASLWLELGLREEMYGNLEEAERCLLEAARLDKTEQPRVALAHYYFRRGNWEQFWPWVRQALETTAGDAGSLFRLCWEATQDHGRIFRSAIPPRRVILRQYVAFLAERGQWEASGQVLALLLERAAAEDVPDLLVHCDRLLEAGKAPPALAVWNTLAARGLIPYQPLDPERGLILTNREFLVRPQSRGFDWRLPDVEGVTITRDETASALRVTFSGRQPEQCEVLWQFVPFAAAKYRFHYEYRSEDLPPGTGPRWRLAAGVQGKAVVIQSAPLSAEEWTQGSLEFATVTAELGRVALMYNRDPGTTRIAGALWLRGLRVERVE